MKSVGLFIGQKVLLGVEFSGSDKSIVIKDLFNYSLTNGIYDEKLETILLEIRQQVKKAQVTISFEPSEDDGIVSSVTQTPQLSDKELKSTMEFEQTKFIGKNNLSKYVLGYKKIAVLKNGEVDNFFMYTGGFKKDHVEHIQQLCRRTNLNLVSIETPLTSTLFLYHYLMKKNENYIDLVITDKSTTFCLFQKGELLYHKKFAFTQSELTESADSRVRLAEDIERVLSPIVRANNLVITKAYISCTSVGIPQLDFTLSAKLNMDFDFFPLKEVLDSNKIKYDESVLTQLGYAYVLPLSVALRPFNKDLSLTLLSAEYVAHLDNFITRQVAVVCVGLLVVGVASGYLYMQSINKTHDSLIKQQTILQQKQNENTQLLGQLNGYRDQLKTLQMDNNQPPVSVIKNIQLGGFLSALQEITPTSIRVYKVSYAPQIPVVLPSPAGTPNGTGTAPNVPAPNAGTPSAPAPNAGTPSTPAPVPAPAPIVSTPNAPAPNAGTPNVSVPNGNNPAGTVVNNGAPTTPNQAGKVLLIEAIGKSFEDIGVFSKKLQTVPNLTSVTVGQVQQIEYGGEKYLSFEIKVGTK